MRVTAARVRAAFRYDKLSGYFFWKEDGPRKRAGRRAGTPNRALGYWVIGVDGGRYYAHDLAWLYVYRRWPKRLEFINGNGFDAA